MKKKRAKSAKPTAEIPETDFSAGTRGKYASALKNNGYTIRVHKRDDSFWEKHVTGESLDQPKN